MSTSTAPNDTFLIDAAELAEQLRARRPQSLAGAAAAVGIGDLAKLPDPVLARLPRADDVAQSNADRIRETQQRPQTREILAALMRRAQEPRIGAKERIRRLRRLYDAWAKDVYPYSACRAGCSHCCHIGVAVTRAEAELISEETHMPLRPQPATSALAVVEATQRAADELARQPRPCTFLSERGRCTIYAFRPLACRQLHNLDADDLLCQLVPGVAVPVPYADATELEILGLKAMREMDMADIRAWFGEAKR